MKTNIEYSDPYRFLVSAGIVLIGLSLLLPWLLLQVSLDIVITTVDLAQLTPAAQAIVERRQTSALWLIENVGFVSALFAAGGFLCLIFGLLFWYRRYRQQEALEILEEQQRRLEAQRALPNTHNTTLEVARRELAAEVEAPRPNESAAAQALSLAWWLGRRHEILGQLEKTFSRTHQMEPAVEVNGENYIFLKARQSINRDVLFKLKPVQDPHDVQWFLDQIARTEVSYQVLKGRHDKSLNRYTLFIVRDGVTLPSDTLEKSISQGLGHTIDPIGWDIVANLALHWEITWRTKLFPQGVKEPLSQRAEGAARANRHHIIWLLMFGAMYSVFTWFLIQLIERLFHYDLPPYGPVVLAVLGLGLAIDGLTRRVTLDGGGVLRFELRNLVAGTAMGIMHYEVPDGPLYLPARAPQLRQVGIRRIDLYPVERGVLRLRLKLSNGPTQTLTVERNEGGQTFIELSGPDVLAITYRSRFSWLDW